jgi:hypothetical protein
MRYDRFMRTTLDIDADVLAVAKDLAQQGGKTTRQILSELARRALEPKAALKIRNGVPLLSPKPGAKAAHLTLVNQLRDDE